MKAFIFDWDGVFNNGIKAGKEGSCGEAKSAKGKEGKCGEGKCGEGKCGGAN